MKKMRKWISILLMVVGVTLLVIGCADHVIDGLYPYGDAAHAAMATTETVAVQRMDNGYAFIPAEVKAGFIFYPGGLVPAEAYTPLMRALAEEGVLCLVPEMPLRLAVLDMNAADGLIAQYPYITRWGIGGHSLGGAMAASYAAGHAEVFDALVLLAAYSTVKVPEDMVVVSVYGDADGVMNRAKYEECRTNLPADAAEIIIPGGNHAQFGDYGQQKGDNPAGITARDQLAQTVQALLPVLLGEQ